MSQFPRRDRDAPPRPAPGRRLPRRLAIALLVLVTLAPQGCATVVIDPREDARIEAEARLVAEKSANLTRLGVVSRQATVYLTGGVESSDQKTLAENLAKGVARSNVSSTVSRFTSRRMTGNRVRIT